MKKRITTVIFDFGGVLGLPQDQQMVASMAALCHLSPPEFVRRCWLKRSEYDRGSLDAGAYWGEILASGGVEPTPDLVERIAHTDSLSWTCVNARTTAWARELRSVGFRTAILSNMPTGTLAFIRRQESLRWVDDFEVAVFSCDYGEIKPDEALFRICLDRLGASPDECAFLDDSATNVDAARALGIQAVRYVSADQVAAELSSWGLPISSLRAV